MSFLQVASWNIEHLSGSPRAQRKQSAFALADHIEMSGIDVIALQEIYVTPDDEELRLFENGPVIKSHAESGWRNVDLDVVCYLLEEHLDRRWSYRILPNRTAGDKSQLCAIMWDTTRLKLDKVTPVEVLHKVDGDNLWDRKPHVVSFLSSIKVWRRDAEGKWQQGEENRRLDIVPLHMKSNYGGITQNRRVRAKEAATLCDALKALRDSAAIDESLILIGDTNILSNTEPAIETFVASGYIDLNNNDAATYWSAQYAEAPFDRVFIPEKRDEFRYTRQYVLRSSDLTQHDRFLSDHYMIKISVKDYVDNADPR